MKIIPFNQFKLGMENFKQVLIRLYLAPMRIQNV